MLQLITENAYSSTLHHRGLALLVLLLLKLLEERSPHPLGPLSTDGSRGEWPLSSIKHFKTAKKK